MKQSLKQWFMAILITITTLLGLTTTTIQAAETGSIEISTNHAIDLSNSDFKAYRLFDVKKVSDDEYVYTIADGFEMFFQKLGCNTSEEARHYIENIKDNPSELDAFAKQVKEYATSYGIQPEGNASATQDKVTISPVAFGYYVVINQQDNAAAAALPKATLVTVDSTTPKKVTLKADAPTLEKTFADGKVVHDYNIGDKVDFKLTTRVPEMDGYDHYKFVIHDKMAKGFTLDKSSVKVTIDGKTYQDVTVTETADGFDIAFGTNGDFISAKDLANKTINVTYSATLNEHAVLGDKGNANTATLEYSNDPYTDHTQTTPDTTVKAYTYGLVINKENSAKEKLANATFNLKSSSGETIKVSGSNGHYRVDPNGTVTDVVTNSDGQIIIDGLQSGEYSLEETKAPDGYNKLKDPITFSITPTYAGDDNMTLTQLTAGNQSFSADKATGQVTATIVNKAGGLLPETGGRGVYIFIIIGLVLIGSATYILYRKRHAA